MDPNMILAGANAILKGGKEISSIYDSVVKTNETKKDGEREREEKRLWGLFDREEQGKDKDIERAIKMSVERRENRKETSKIIFSAFDTVTRTAQVASDIIIAQRQSKADTAKIYADIEQSQQALTAKIDNDRKTVDAEIRKIDADIERQCKEDALKLKEFEAEYQFKKTKLESEIKLAEERQVGELEIQKMKLSIEIASSNAETNKIELQNQRYAEDTQLRKVSLNKTLEVIDMQLTKCREISTLNLTDENIEKLNNEIQLLIQTQASFLSMLSNA